MIDDPYEMVLRALRQHGFQVTGQGRGASSAQCPVHGDTVASMSVSRGDRQPVVITCHRNPGCPSEDILAAIGLSWGDLCSPQDDRGPDLWMPCHHTKVAEYEYRDRHGALVFAVARCSEKGKTCQGFRQWRPDPTAGRGKKWTRRLPDGTRAGEGLPYRLPDLLVHSPVWNVWIVEGEKDADRLWSMGVPATCNPEGAGKWTPAHSAWLAGRDVMIVADRDEPGWAHAENVAGGLLESARSIEVVQAATGKDISDHLDAGQTLAQVITVAVAKPPPAIGPDGEDVAG